MSAQLSTPLIMSSVCRLSVCISPITDNGTQRVRGVYRLRRLTLAGLKYFLYKPWRPKGYFQFEIIINVLIGSFRFI